MSEDEPQVWRVADEAAMHDFAEAIGGRLRAGDVLALCGSLGAGKTHFTQGLARGAAAAALLEAGGRGARMRVAAARRPTPAVEL